jgi:hypothetical protein
MDAGAGGVSLPQLRSDRRRVATLGGILGPGAPAPMLPRPRWLPFVLLLPVFGVPTPAGGVGIGELRALGGLIRASGTAMIVSDDCPPDHAGYYENDGGRIDRLVICRDAVDLDDVRAVWEVLAHEATHVMQACRGTPVLPDAQMPRTLHELRVVAPHYAKLIDRGYARTDQRLEAEAFWMELQPPALVMALFRSSCQRFLPEPLEP